MGLKVTQSLMKSDALINEMLAAVDAEKSRATMETDRAWPAAAGRKVTTKRHGDSGRLLLDRKPWEISHIDIIWMVVSNVQMFFIFIPIWGNDPILTNIFQMGWNHQPVMLSSYQNTIDSYHPYDFIISIYCILIWSFVHLVHFYHPCLGCTNDRIPMSSWYNMIPGD